MRYSSALLLSALLLTHLASAAQVLECDYETGTINSGKSGVAVQGAAFYSIQVDSNTKRHGVYSIREELRYGDPWVAGGPRAESDALNVSQTRYKAGDTVYYGFSVYIISSWVNDDIYEDVVFQWHNIPDYDLGETSKNPNIFLCVKRMEWDLRITSDPTLVTTATSALKEQVKLSDMVPGWHDFVFAIKWSYNGDGNIKCWYKRSSTSTYAQVLDKTGPNMHNDRQLGYIKWGIYKPAWRNGPTAASSRVVFHDNVRVGTSFSLVDPSVP